MRKFSAFHVFVLLALIYSAGMLWCTYRSSSPTYSQNIKNLSSLSPKYESISIKADTFKAKLIAFVKQQRGISNIKKNELADEFIFWYQGGNIYRDFGILDSTKFYKSWSEYVNYDSASAMLKMKFPVSDSMIQVPAELVFTIFPKN